MHFYMNTNVPFILLVVLLLAGNSLYAKNHVNRFMGSEIGIPNKKTNDPSITRVLHVSVRDTLMFELFKERIIADLLEEKRTEVHLQDAKVTSYLAQLEADGAFPTIDYKSTVRTNWPPLVHLDRLMVMGLAYTNAESSYYGDGVLKEKMDAMLRYWQNEQPRSSNWFYNQIGEPKLMGQYLILIESLGQERIPEILLSTAVARLANNGGQPSSQAGANRIDVALHHMYRACLLEDYDLLNKAMAYIYSPLELTKGAEGIQYDNSYTQHGRQLYIGSYGQVFLEGITKAAMYAVGTDCAIPADRLEILSSLVKDSYAHIFRGEYVYFSTIGRAVTRPGAVKKTKNTHIFERMKTLDASNKQVYENVILRLKGEHPAYYEVPPWSTHYYHSDYTVHNKPAYSVDLRMVSTRTVRNEYLSDNGEGIKQYFMSDGATGIFVDGDEYDDIFPVWNWSKIPGVTAPEFTTVPQASSYIQHGESDFVGGVTDHLNAVSVYRYKDTYSGIDTSANKAWFFFDEEVVCLGNTIKSTSGFKVNTTVNQCLLEGDVLVFDRGNKSTVASGDYKYKNTLDWVYHDKVAYFFPENGTVDLSAQQHRGDWSSINANYQEEPAVTKDVFTLSFNHGIDPTEGAYAYVIVPGISESEAQAYDISNIEVLVNSDSIQAVYHKKQRAYGFVFYKAASFVTNGFAIEVDAGCVLMVKDVDKKEPIVFVADPKNGTDPINVHIKTPAIKVSRMITYKAVDPHLGRSIKLDSNLKTPF